MVLRKFENRLERLVEGMFARVFKSGLQPVEIGRRLIKDLDANRTIDVRGRTIVPNRFVVQLASQDHERFAQIDESLRQELASTIREHAAQNDWHFLGRVGVALAVEPDLVVGTVRTEASFDEGPVGGGPGAFLELTDGTQVTLGTEVASLGRLPESTLVLVDPNASRRHAELHPEGDTYLLVDLGSTNGSLVNGIRVASQLLSDGDELTFGIITVVFRQP